MNVKKFLFIFMLLGVFGARGGFENNYFYPFLPPFFYHADLIEKELAEEQKRRQEEISRLEKNLFRLPEVLRQDVTTTIEMEKLVIEAINTFLAHDKLSEHEKKVTDFLIESSSDGLLEKPPLEEPSVFQKSLKTELQKTLGVELQKIFTELDETKTPKSLLENKIELNLPVGGYNAKKRFIGVSSKEAKLKDWMEDIYKQIVDKLKSIHGSILFFNKLAIGLIKKLCKSEKFLDFQELFLDFSKRINKAISDYRDNAIKEKKEKKAGLNFWSNPKFIKDFQLSVSRIYLQKEQNSELASLIRGFDDIFENIDPRKWDFYNKFRFLSFYKTFHTLAENIFSKKNVASLSIIRHALKFLKGTFVEIGESLFPEKEKSDLKAKLDDVIENLVLAEI